MIKLCQNFIFLVLTRLVVDRDKPRIQIWNYGVGMTQGFQTNWTSHYHSDGFKVSFNIQNVLLEHVGLPCVLPIAVHLDLGHITDTQDHSGLISELGSPTQTFRPGGVVVVVAHEILVTAQKQNSFLPFLDLTWAWTLELDLASGLLIFRYIFVFIMYDSLMHDYLTIREPDQ